jgi:hypothetical protein
VSTTPVLGRVPAAGEDERCFQEKNLENTRRRAVVLGGWHRKAVRDTELGSGGINWSLV